MRKMTDLSKRIVDIIKSIPRGKVLSYGDVAALAGAPGAARQVSWLLRTQTEKYNLPWFRVINSKGRISIKDFVGYELQKSHLLEEGVDIDDKDYISKTSFWDGNQ